VNRKPVRATMDAQPGRAAGEGWRNTIDAAEQAEIEQLVRQLDASTTDEAMDAQAELTQRGRETDVVGPLLRALPGLSRYAQLCAIEILEELNDPRASQPLIALLSSEHDTVREWAAGALGRMQTYEAIPALMRAHEATKERDDRPDWSESVALRSALTELDARHPVVPPLSASLRVTTPVGWHAWPVARLVEVIDDLATHNQVTLYFQLWRVTADGQMYGTARSCDATDLDFTKPWPALVHDAQRRALAEASQVQLDEHVFATIEWIDQSDI
jgi:HEAT repeat protein